MTTGHGTRAAVAVGALLLGLAGPSAVAAISGDLGREARPTQPCVNEDGPGPCFWDGSTRGNGLGRSYWIDRVQQYHYIDGMR